ncbi:MAG TPA: AAA-associated domain-containing protein [Candidatus Sulfopaludibacter sp.]|nr:AAA-associated domain-containing protein [Candidatus Sulfopaludibacter sp.]
MTNTPSSERLRALLSQSRWEQAVALLQQMPVADAAELLMGLPIEEQKTIFRQSPTAFAAGLVSAVPYYHAYILLHTRSLQDLNAIVDQMSDAGRVHFFDELPEEAWEQLLDETAEAEKQAAAAPSPEVEKAVESAGGPAIIEARGIEKVFQRPGGGQVQVIAPTDLSVEAGQIIALLGPSGSGKSTLLRILTGLTRPSSGEVYWHGRPIRECAPHLAIVFQSFALFPWLTVQDNVEAPLLAKTMAAEERAQRATAALASVGLQGFETAYPKDLSGGMKQRVGFARALAVEPEILFMDEPFSALDVLTADSLRGELMELWLGKRIPTRSIFIVTHNIEEAVLLADRVLVLGRNPGRIRADFRVALPQPRERTAADFLVYVDYIYKLITQPEVEPAPLSTRKGRYPMLPHARPGSIAGLLELLNDREGTEDLYKIADDLRMEVDDLLPIVDASTLLGLAVSTKGEVEISPAGREFAEADITRRKRLFRDAALANVRLLQQMKSGLENKKDHTMPAEFFRDVLDEYFSDSEVDRQLDTALNWGRYGDILRYDSESDKIMLYDETAEAGVTDAMRQLG